MCVTASGQVKEAYRTGPHVNAHTADSFRSLCYKQGRFFYLRRIYVSAAEGNTNADNDR